MYNKDTTIQAPVYGMGDLGGIQSNANIAGREFNIISNEASVRRYVSTFAIYPSERFAQVIFADRSKRVSFSKEMNMMGVNDSTSIDGIYYFVGDTAEDLVEIYANYKAAREREEYIDAKPNYEMFGVGYEAYGALGWNAKEAPVKNSIQKYLDEGYNLAWGVIGSGFWESNYGRTTGFGYWNRDEGQFPNAPTIEQAQAGIIPENSVQEFFQDKNIKLLLGLRVQLSAEPSKGGGWNPETCGPYLQEALDNGYLLTEDDGELMRVYAISPGGKSYIIDGNNPAAEWYARCAELWQVDGYKEDAMIHHYENSDSVYNNLMLELANKDNVLIIRNGAYSLPGDVLRLNDSFPADPSRTMVNMFSYAASGQGNVYPDIIGSKNQSVTEQYRNFFIRNAVAVSLTPSLSVGRGVWDLQNDAQEAIVRDAVAWHSDYVPYIYDAALKNYNTGFPYAFTPLYLAYPDDANTYNRIDKEIGRAHV